MLYIKKLKKKYLVKIPQNVSVVHCDKKNIIVFKGPLNTKSLELKVKVFLIPSLNLISVTDIFLSDTSGSDFRGAKKLQGMVVAKLKQMLIETSYKLYHKLNLIGVGYRVFSHEGLEKQIYLKLGYSHFIYFKIPLELNTYCHKFTKLFIFGECSFSNLKQTASQIRDCKLPEPYKGKGILHDQETITLKKGKKI